MCTQKYSRTPSLDTLNCRRLQKRYDTGSHTYFLGKPAEFPGLPRAAWTFPKLNSNLTNDSPSWQHGELLGRRCLTSNGENRPLRHSVMTILRCYTSLYIRAEPLTLQMTL